MFICKNCGSCCSLVPVLDWQLKRIQKQLLLLPITEQERLKNQKRPRFMCPLRDIEKQRCAVHDVRPTVCKHQGLYEGLPCPHNKIKLKSKEDGFRKMLEENGPDEKLAGVLGIQINWPQLLPVGDAE